MAEHTTVTLAGGRCAGMTVDLDPKDAGLRIEAAVWGDGALALGRLTLPRLDELRGARWELYQRDRQDAATYRHVEDYCDQAHMYDPDDAGDRWVWPGWGDWSDPP